MWIGCGGIKRAAIGASGRQPARSEGAAEATAKSDVILVDTFVWVEHLRANDRALAVLLETGAVLAHPFVIGELALLRHRDRAETRCRTYPTPASPPIWRFFIWSIAIIVLRGIEYIDADLLATVRLMAGAALWTKDKRPHGVAMEMGLAMTPVRRHFS